VKTTSLEVHVITAYGRSRRLGSPAVCVAVGCGYGDTLYLYDTEQFLVTDRRNVSLPSA